VTARRADTSYGANTTESMRIAVFGANGATGRHLVDHALTAGHHVVAVTRNPNDIRPRDGLTVAGADVTDAEAVDAAIAGCDAVLSALGVSYSSKPISVYSVGATNIIAAMERHRVKRLVLVSSASIDPAYHPSNSVFYTRIVEPYFMRKPGRTLYEDTSRMEALVQASALNWTIMRSAWLFESTAVTDYQVRENTAGGMYTGPADLAASLLAQLNEDRFVRKIAAVNTTVGTPNMIKQIWREGIRKPHKH
jgi:putative NADH-flavin reductase